MGIYGERLVFTDILIAHLALLVTIYFAVGWTKHHKNWFSSTIIMVLVFLLLFISTSELLIFKYSGVAFEKQTFLHLEPEALWVGFAIHPIKYSVAVLVLLLVCLLLFFQAKPIKLNKVSLLGFVLALIFLVYSIYGISAGRLLINYQQFIENQKIENLSAEDVADLKAFGIQPVAITKDTIEAEFLGKKRNLIVIYLESFSKGFVDSKKFPDLTPRINQLRAQHGEFENYQSTAKFTMQGLMSSICGLIPKTMSGNNISIDQMPYQQLPCLTDVLNKLNYQQEFIGGARKNFSNKATFLTAKGFDQVYGWLDFKKPKTYQTNDWGLQDTDLFDFALRRVIELDQKQQPYHLSLLTLATHLNGNPDPSCPLYLNQAKHHKFIQGIHCADFLLGQFIDELQKLNLLEHTSVLITSDHGVFPVPLIKQQFGTDFERNQLLGVLIDDSSFDQTLPLGLYDLAPTLIDSLHIKSNINFINGRSPSEINHDRYLLREAVLNGHRIPQGSCHTSIEINFPVDPCENQFLVQSTWRYATNFNQKDHLINLNKRIEFSRYQSGNSWHIELFLDGNEQLSAMMKHGYPLTPQRRKKSSHIYLLVYDLGSQKIASRNAFDIAANQVKSFQKLIQSETDRPRYYFIFTENGLDIQVQPAWKDTINSLGAQQFDFPNKAYFAVFKRSQGSTQMVEYSSDPYVEETLSFSGIQSLNWIDSAFNQ